MAYQEGTGSTLEEALSDAIQQAKANVREPNTPMQWKLIDVKGESGGTDSFSVRIEFRFLRKSP